MKDFIKENLFLFKEYYAGKIKFEEGETWIKGNLSLLESQKIRYESKKSEYIYCWGDEACQQKILGYYFYIYIYRKKNQNNIIL